MAGGLRVLQIIPVLRIGGLERVATTLSIELARRGHRVVVASMGGEPFEPILVAAGVPVARIPRPRAQPKRLATSSYAIARLLRRERPEIVHAHNPAAAVTVAVARVLAGMPRLPIVTTYHGVMPGRIDRAARVMETVSEVVVGVGPSSTGALLRSGLDPAKAHTIANAVDPSRRRTREEVREEFGASEAELVVTVGRYAPEKNQALLIDAAAALLPSRPRLRLLLVGDGLPEHEQVLHDRIAMHGVADAATVTGERDDAVDVIAAADVFVLSSDSEGLPLVLLEALAVGTPIVSTDAGGVGDAIEDGRTGLLVPVRDAGALAGAVARLLDDRPFATELAEEGRRFVERTCSAAAMTDAYVELYRETVARRRAVS